MFSLFLEFPIFFSERILYAFLGGGGPDFCLHFLTTCTHITDVGSRGSETENLRPKEQQKNQAEKENKNK